MDNLEMVPLDEIFKEDNGDILVGGKVVDVDKAFQLREQANVALDNSTLNLITEQVAYEAFVGGVHKCVTPEDLYFYRAALWWGQRVKKHLMSLAGRDS